MSEGTSAKKAVQALRSAGVVDMNSLVELLSRRRIKSLLALLLSVMSGAALAQTTGALNPSPVPAQPSVNEDVPPGGCMPIGLTVSGEVVFPIQCREFIERHRGAAVEQKPAAVEEKSAAKQSEEVAPENGKLENKPVDSTIKALSTSRASEP